MNRMLKSEVQQKQENKTGHLCYVSSIIYILVFYTENALGVYLIVAEKDSSGLVTFFFPLNEIILFCLWHSY